MINENRIAGTANINGWYGPFARNEIGVSSAAIIKNKLAIKKIF